MRPRKKLFYQIDLSTALPSWLVLCGPPPGRSCRLFWRIHRPLRCFPALTTTKAVPTDGALTQHSLLPVVRLGVGQHLENFLGEARPQPARTLCPGQPHELSWMPAPWLSAAPALLSRSLPPTIARCRRCPRPASWLQFSLDLLLPPNPTPAQHLGSTLGGRCLLARAAASMSWFPHIGPRQQEGDQHDLRGAGRPFNWAASSS